MFNLILFIMKNLTAEAKTQVTTSTQVINGGNLIQADKPKTASYKRVVIGSNSILKEQCFKLGYARDILLNNEESILTAQKKNKEFNELDLSRLLDIFSILEDSKRNSKLYKAIESLKSIKTKTGKFVPFNILRAVNTNMDDLKPMLTPIK